MKIKKHIKNIFVAASAVAMMTTTLSSCNEWLDVKPSNQVEASEMFSTENGFKLALTGVYTLMAHSDLYGREMTYGTVGYLGSEWVLADPFSSYEQVSRYEYEATESKLLTDAMWSKQYNAIANVNDLLAYVDVNKNVFQTQDSYDLIKGEALALRAYLHLDMLRLYAPYTFDGNTATEEKWLPYVDEFSRNTTLSITNSDFAEKVMADIDAALELMANDPIVTNEVSSDTYFQNRIYHLNYYGVMALKARAALYFGDKTTALAAAKTVIDAQNTERFRWVTSNEVTYPTAEHRDRTFSSEHIFALNVYKMKDYIQGYFESPVSLLELNVSNTDEFVQGDYRSVFVVNDDLTKFNQPEEQTGNHPDQTIQRMPMLRISEMYYIAAECEGSIEYINTVRLYRGYEEAVPENLFETTLEDEVIREFIGEGQRFYFLKRTNASIKDIRYTLIMPDNEIDFGGRPRPEF